LCALKQSKLYPNGNDSLSQHKEQIEVYCPTRQCSGSPKNQAPADFVVKQNDTMVGDTVVMKKNTISDEPQSRTKARKQQVVLSMVVSFIRLLLFPILGLLSLIIILITYFFEKLGSAFTPVLLISIALYIAASVCFTLSCRRWLKRYFEQNKISCL